MIIMLYSLNPNKVPAIKKKETNKNHFLFLN